MTKQFITLIITLLLSIEVFGQLQFEKSVHDFGLISEEGGAQSCRFVAVNRGKVPIVIVDVVTTCGCTTPEFSRKPILAGEQTEIEVSYDPYNRPGTFDRQLYLYGPQNKRLGTLTIRGEVKPRERSIEERFPIEIDGGVRLAATMVTIPHIYIGAPMQSAVSIINASDKPRRLRLEPTTSSGQLRITYPEQLAAGEQTAINVYYEIAPEKPIYGAIRDVFTLYIDDQPSEKKLVVHGTAVDKPTKTLKEFPPKMEFSENILKFGALNRRTKPTEQTFTIRNEGSSELIIRAVECDKRITTDLQSQTRIPAGGQQSVTVRIDPSRCDYGFVTAWLTLVTNEPDRPIRRLRITAIIEG